MTEEQKQKIIEFYPTMSGSEIGKILGLSRQHIHLYAKKMGLSHTDECWRRIKKIRSDAITKGHTKSSYEKSRKTRRRTYRRELLRLLSGQQKESKITVSILSYRCRRRMTMLCYMYDYFRDPDINKSVVYYDEKTRRNGRAEAFAAKYYGVKFIDANG